MDKFGIYLLLIFFNFLSFGTAKAYNTAEYIKLITPYSTNQIRNAILYAEEHGLNTAAYWSPEMEKQYQSNSNSNDLKNRSVHSYLRLLKDVSTGIVDPALLGVEVRMTKKAFVRSEVLKQNLAKAGGDLGQTLENMSSKIPQYLGLRKSLQRMYSYCKSNQWPAVPQLKRTLKQGTSDSVVNPLKVRLQQLGYTINNFDNTVDAQTIQAINDIQWNLRMRPDSTISPGGRTWQYLNVNCQTRTQQMRADMEKLRWFPQYLESRYIFVNLAMSYLNMVDRSTGSSEYMNFRTINGRPERKTPTMRDKIVAVTINPYWIVPPTIFREDKVEEIKHLEPYQVRRYFEEHNYEVWNKNFTQRIDPGSINWNSLDVNNAQIYIRQKPHTGNALGVAKFVLTNSFAIYLHDTNQRTLFSYPDRQLSSGCVRVEKPVDMATYLLRGTKWNRSEIENAMAKPGQVMTTDTNINVPTPIPVYMAYLTSQWSSDGVLRFTEDSYLQNVRLFRLGVW